MASFLTNRTQQVKVGSSLSATCDVTSGVIQGSVLGPDLYKILTNSLLQSISIPQGSFADDLKFAADVAVYTRDRVQSEINKVTDWADVHHMQLSVEKSCVLHCGVNQPNYQYTLNGQPMTVVSTVTDLGVIRTSDSRHSEQCKRVAIKAARVANGIRRAFRCRAKELLWPAFQIYAMPILSYCSQVWSPVLKRDIGVLEHVQRKFTKYIRGIEHLSYEDRLRSLSALSLEHRRSCVDMTTVFKCLHGRMDCTPSDLGLSVSTSNTRGKGIRLGQRCGVSRVCDSLFVYRAPSEWNNLPLNISSCSSLNSFKDRLYEHYTCISMQ